MPPVTVLLALHGAQAPPALADGLRSEGLEVLVTRNLADTWNALREEGPEAVVLVPVDPRARSTELASLLQPPAGVLPPAVLVLTADPMALTERAEALDDFVHPGESVAHLAARVHFGVARRRAYQRLLEASTTDFKTGLANDRRFAEECHIETARAVREGHPLSVLLIDLDDFKAINDEHDHDFGDHALRRLADTLREHLRPFDTPARKGGDEFAVLLPHTSLEQATSIAERLRATVADLQLEHGGHRRKLTITLGVATWHPDRDESIEQVLLAADKALLAAKDGGRNRVGVHPDGAAPPADDESEAEAGADADASPAPRKASRTTRKSGGKAAPKSTAKGGAKGARAKAPRKRTRRSPVEEG